MPSRARRALVDDRHGDPELPEPAGQRSVVEQHGGHVDVRLPGQVRRSRRQLDLCPRPQVGRHDVAYPKRGGPDSKARGERSSVPGQRKRRKRKASWLRDLRAREHAQAPRVQRAVRGARGARRSRRKISWRRPGAVGVRKSASVRSLDGAPPGDRDRRATDGAEGDRDRRAASGSGSPTLYGAGTSSALSERQLAAEVRESRRRHRSPVAAIPRSGR